MYQYYKSFLRENKELITTFRNTHDKTKFLDVTLVKRWKMKYVKYYM